MMRDTKGHPHNRQMMTNLQDNQINNQIRLMMNMMIKQLINLLNLKKSLY